MRLPLLVAALFAVLYTFFNALIPAHLDVFVKIIPMLLLMYTVWRQHPADVSFQRWLIISLFFCMLGDATIGFQFLVGLLCFLIGNISYIYTFRKVRARVVPRSVTLVLMLYGAVMLTVFFTTLIQAHDYILLLAICVYICAILAMGLTAFSTMNRYLYSGAILFIISDSILAVNLFVMPIPLAHELVMLTYYSAQFCFSYSVCDYSEFRNKVIQ